MIKKNDSFTAIVAKEELKIREIFQFSREVYPKLLESIEENGLEIIGEPTFISYGRDGSLEKTFLHEICIPIQSGSDYEGDFEIKEFRDFKCVTGKFTGTINQISRNGIPEVLAEAKDKNEILTNEMREVYHEWHKPRSKKNVVELQFGLK